MRSRRCKLSSAPEARAERQGTFFGEAATARSDVKTTAVSVCHVPCHVELVAVQFFSSAAREIGDNFLKFRKTP